MKFEIELEQCIVEMFLRESSYFKTQFDQQMQIKKLADASSTEIEKIRKYLEDYAVELAFDAHQRVEDSIDIIVEHADAAIDKKSCQYITK